MDHTECHLQHTLSTTRRIKFNHNVVKLLDFVLEHQNPYSAVVVNVPVPLRNLLTKQAVDQKLAADLLKCLEDGERFYHTYRRKQRTQADTYS